MIDKIEQTTDVTPKNGVMQHDKQRPLTGKERAYIEYRVENPTSTKAEAIRAVYDVSETTKKKTLENMASTIEKRPAVLAVLNKHAIEAEETLADVMKYSRIHGSSGTKEGASYAQVAERTANSILDRLHGKAMQQIQMNSTSVNINVDLSQ